MPTGGLSIVGVAERDGGGTFVFAFARERTYNHDSNTNMLEPPIIRGECSDVTNNSPARR